MSLTHMATRSMPIVEWLSVSIAILSLVPTPSFAATSTGSLKPAALRSKSPPNPPISASAPERRVERTAGLMASTRALPASMSTPACLYESPFDGRFCASDMGLYASYGASVLAGSDPDRQLSFPGLTATSADSGSNNAAQGLPG